MSGELDFGPRRLNIVEGLSRYCNWATGWTTKEKSEFDYRQGKEILSSPQRSERLWAPSSRVSSAYRSLLRRA